MDPRIELQQALISELRKIIDLLKSTTRVQKETIEILQSLNEYLKAENASLIHELQSYRLEIK